MGDDIVLIIKKVFIGGYFWLPRIDRLAFAIIVSWGLYMVWQAQGSGAIILH